MRLPPHRGSAGRFLLLSECDHDLGVGVAAGLHCDGVGLTASMAGALSRRGVPDLTSRVAAELGALAWEIAYERWSDTANGDDFSELARRALGELQAASALC